MEYYKFCPIREQRMHQAVCEARLQAGKCRVLHRPKTIISKFYGKVRIVCKEIVPKNNMKK